MNETDIKRITRLTAILTHLQSKRLLQLANLQSNFQLVGEQYNVTSEHWNSQGFWLITEDGKGYTLMGHY